MASWAGVTPGASKENNKYTKVEHIIYTTYIQVNQRPPQTSNILVELVCWDMSIHIPSAPGLAFPAPARGPAHGAKR